MADFIRLREHVRKTLTEDLSVDPCLDILLHAADAEYKGKVLDQLDSEMKQAMAWMDDTWEHFRVKWAAEAVRAMWPVAEQAMKKLRGAKGTPVKVELRRRGYDALIPLDVVRDEVQILTVPAHFMIDATTGCSRPV